MYDFLPIQIASSGMAAQRIRMGVIASNLANAQSTRSADGAGPYQRRMVVFQTQGDGGFSEILAKESRPTFTAKGDDFETLRLASGSGSTLVEEHLRGVAVSRIERDPAVRRVYEPGHADADAEGYVSYPEISIIQEMTDMIAAERCYTANLATLKNTRDMIAQTLDLLKS